MSGHDTAFGAKPALNPTALPIADAAHLLSPTGGHPVTPEQIRADIDVGAPLTDRRAQTRGGDHRIADGYYAALSSVKCFRNRRWISFAAARRAGSRPLPSSRLRYESTSTTHQLVRVSRV